MNRARVWIVTLAGGFGEVITPGGARAHHPGAITEGPLAWLGLLVVALAFALVWPLLAFLERRQGPPSERGRRRKR